GLPRWPGRLAADECRGQLWDRAESKPRPSRRTVVMGGQRAIQPASALWPPRAFAMLSAVMTHLAGAGRSLRIIVRSRKSFGPRPFVEDRKEGGDVLDDL